MSLISDATQRAALVLDRAAAAGLPEDELAKWRRDLDPAGLDLCGCRASFITLALTLACGLAIELVAGFSLLRTGLWLIVAFFAAAVAKVVRSTQMEHRFRERLVALAAISNGS